MQAEPEKPEIHASERGTGPQTVVFVHGFGADHRAWDAIAASLPQDTRTLAYDLPGHGLSLEAQGAGSAKFAARTILADLARRGIDNAHVAGHSMGGAVAALMALSEPQRIASLTLLAPGGFGAEINGPLLRHYAKATGSDEIRACLLAMSGEGAIVAEDTLATYVAARRCPGQIEKLVEIAAAITQGDRQGVIAHEALAALAMPVTVLWGTGDPILPFAQTGSLPAHFKLHAVEGAGHMLISEVPGLVCEAILANLADLV
jgi:pyruvate dehydrogenase E2 component (dihydrolipoamide acetyltransferase)